MPYPNKFSDGHAHNTSATSKTGLPQCSLCGRVSTKGQSIKRDNTITKVTSDPNMVDMNKKKKGSNSTPKQDSSAKMLGGEIVNLANRYGNDKARLRAEMESYLKNRRSVKND